MLGSGFNNLLGGKALDKAVRTLNDYDWNLTIRDDSNGWSAWTGDQLLFRSQDRAELDAFLEGMALMLLLFPPNIQQLIKDAISP